MEIEVVRFKWFIGIASLILVLSGCFEESNDTDDQQTDPAPAETEEVGADDESDQQADSTPTPTVVETEEASADDQEEGSPRTKAAELIELAKNDEWDEVRANTVDTFQSFSLDAFAQLPGIQHYPDVAIQADSWDVENHETFSVARISEFPSAALVLRNLDGIWRYDPGPYQITRFRAFDEDLERESTTVEWEQSVESNDDMLASQLLRASIEQVDVENQLRVSIQFMPSGTDEMTIQMEDIFWRVNEEEFTADVDWTTTLIEEGTFGFPHIGGGSVYFSTFTLDEYSSEEQVELVFQNIRSADDEGEFEFSLIFSIPVEEYPQLSTTMLHPSG